MLYIREIESFLVIGGFSFGGEEGLGSGEELSVVAKFKDGAWSNVGQLKSARSVSFWCFFSSFFFCSSNFLEWSFLVSTFH